MPYTYGDFPVTVPTLFKRHLELLQQDILVTLSGGVIIKRRCFTASDAIKGAGAQFHEF